MTLSKTNYTQRIEEAIYNGEKIVHIEHSLYQVGQKKIMIMTREKKEESDGKYFFGINFKFMDEVEDVIFVCTSELIAFNIPSRVLNGLNFNTNKEKTRLLTEIKHDKNIDNWYLTFKKDENGNNKRYIDDFLICLKSDEEIAAEALAIQEILGVKSVNKEEKEKNIFDDLIAITEASIIWGTSISTIKRFIKDGRIIDGVDCKNFGKQWVITKEAMERVFDGYERKSKSNKK